MVQHKLKSAFENMKCSRVQRWMAATKASCGAHPISNDNNICQPNGIIQVAFLTLG